MKDNMLLWGSKAGRSHRHPSVRQADGFGTTSRNLAVSHVGPHFTLTACCFVKKLNLQ